MIISTSPPRRLVSFHEFSLFIIYSFCSVEFVEFGILFDLQSDACVGQVLCLQVVCKQGFLPMNEFLLLVLFLFFVPDSKAEA